MRRHLGLAFAFVFFWLTVSAVAQQSDRSRSQVALARCAYMPSTPGCAALAADSSGQSSVSAAQFPRRMPGPRGYPPPPPRMRMAGPMPAPSLKGALIGGLIGFGVGAARSGDTSPKGRVGMGLLVGGLGAVIGAGIGAALPGPYHHRRAAWPDDEAASDRRSGNKAGLSSTVPPTKSDSDSKTARNRVAEGTGTGQRASDE